MNDEAPLAEMLHRGLAVQPQDLTHLHDRLAASAAADGVLDVAHRTVDSPVGELLLAATETGLVRVAYACEGHDDVLQDLSDRIGSRILRHPARLDAAARELDEYFAGDRRHFEVHLDWRLADGFRAAVLRRLPDIAYGETASYGAVAGLAGRPRAARAVGTACATNPLPIVVPCHRVVRADGALGGYLGGEEAKALLLRHEAAA